MTIDEFRLYSVAEQDEIVTRDGIYLVNYLQGDTMCDVYKLQEFFVKFCYDVMKSDYPVITAFSSNEDFRLYLDALYPVQPN